MRFRYRVLENSYRCRLNRRKDVLTLSIPDNFGIFPDDPDAFKDVDYEEIDGVWATATNTGNEYATQFAIEAAKRLKLAHENISDDSKFIEAVNAIIYIYITHYHYMDTIYYGKIDHNQTPDFGSRSDSASRDPFADYQHKLREAASRLRDIPIEDIADGWDSYYG